MQREIFEKKQKNLFQQNMGRDRKNERPQSAGNALRSNFKSFFFFYPSPEIDSRSRGWNFHSTILPGFCFREFFPLPREIVQKNRGMKSRDGLSIVPIRIIIRRKREMNSFGNRRWYYCNIILLKFPLRVYKQRAIKMESLEFYFLQVEKTYRFFW